MKVAFAQFSGGAWNRVVAYDVRVPDVGEFVDLAADGAVVRGYVKMRQWGTDGVTAVLGYPAERPISGAAPGTQQAPTARQ